MSLLARVHGDHVAGRRVERLADLLVGLLPAGVRVLDVGCGDGRLASRIMDLRPDVEIVGIDVLVRDRPAVPVRPFDGRTIPEADGAFDVALLVDVLHHSDDPGMLLREVSRVVSRAVLVKDHLADGFLARPLLRFMDRVGNQRHGVALPYNYWDLATWRASFDRLGLAVDAWETDLRLYAWPADRVFGRSLHFLARLSPTGRGESADSP